MAEVSLLEKLVTVLRSRHVAVGDDCGNTSGRMTQGSAVDLAQALLGTVRQHDEAPGRKRDDGETYPELAAVAAICTALDAIDDGESAGQPRGPFWRVLTYIASRYGYVLATED